MASELLGEMRQGSASVTMNGPSKLSYKSEWSFLVVTDSKDVQREEVLFNTPGLPVVGITYGAIGAVCLSKSIRRIKEHACHWEVTCQFDTAFESQKVDANNPGPNGSPNPDPTTWIPVLKISGYEMRETVVEEDRTGAKNFNSAKTPFSEPLLFKRSCPIFPFFQFESPSLTVKEIADRNESVNVATINSAIGSFGVRTLKLNVTDSELGFYLGVAAWKINYTLTYDTDTWDEKRVNMGPKDINGNLCLSQGNQKNIPIIAYLSAAGLQLNPGDDPTYKTFRLLRELNFERFIRGFN